MPANKPLLRLIYALEGQGSFETAILSILFLEAVANPGWPHLGELDRPF